MKAVALLVLCLGFLTGAFGARPVVLMHGIHANKTTMEPWVEFITSTIPDVYVLNVEIGNGVFDSMFMELDDMLEIFSKTVQSDPKLAHGFNLVCHSQGSLICRGFVEKYNEPKVHTFVALNGPLSGVFGIYLDGYDLLIDEFASDVMYTEVVQEMTSVGGYWKDPIQLKKYLKHSHYLPYLNNEFPADGEGRKVFNQTFKDNFSSLERLVLYYSPIDDTVKPALSAWFGFYEAGSGTKVVPCYEQDYYKKDLFGLRTLVESGRVTFLSNHTTHVESQLPTFFTFYDRYIKQYLL